MLGSSGCLLRQYKKKVLPRGRIVLPTALCQVSLMTLPQVRGKVVLQPPGPGIPGERVSLHVSMGTATCLFLCTAALEGCLVAWSIFYHRECCSR